MLFEQIIQHVFHLYTIKKRDRGKSGSKVPNPIHVC
uniref:Uncharacterized protein n=1 Tax=Lepeophtheirus salmonis TaxID=72036 RepID=A0A0K2TLM2_LEPSM